MILLINPNSSQATTDMMVAIAQAASGDVAVVGATAGRGVAMIVDAAALTASEAAVIAIGLRAGPDVTGIVVSAFGDPGVAPLRAASGVPVVGIAEAAMREAAQGGRRFGVATVTPGLVGAIDAKAAELGLAGRYTGIRLTAGDPLALAADPERLVAALGVAVRDCIGRDGAEAVVIGGGPLGDAATALAKRFSVPIVAPIPAAVRWLLGLHRAP